MCITASQGVCRSQKTNSCLQLLFAELSLSSPLYAFSCFLRCLSSYKPADRFCSTLRSYLTLDSSFPSTYIDLIYLGLVHLTESRALAYFFHCSLSVYLNIYFLFFVSDTHSSTSNIAYPLVNQGYQRLRRIVRW